MFELESQCLDILFGSIFSTLSLSLGSHHPLAHSEPAQERVRTAAAVGFRSGSAVWGGLGSVASCHWILLSAGVAQRGTGGLSPRWHTLPGRSALALGLGAQLGLWPGGLVSSPHGHLHRVVAWASLHHGSWFPRVDDWRGRRWKLRVLRSGPRGRPGTASFFPATVSAPTQIQSEGT